MTARRRVRIRRAPVAAWDAYPAQREREMWNRFKLAYRQAHPLEGRGKAYYRRVRLAYMAQAHGTLDSWLFPPDSDGGGGGPASHECGTSGSG